MRNTNIVLRYISYWWDLSNVRRLADPIPCRGNVGMWQLPKSLAAKVEAAVERL